MSELLFGEVNYNELDEAKSYPRVINEELVELKKKEVMKYLEGWTLHTDEETGEYYFKHEASKLKYEVVRMHYDDNESQLVPRYNPDSDLAGNAGYRIVKDKGRERRVLLSETTYTVRENGEVERMGFSDFWNSRRGKRYQKYLNYMKRRKEKKRVYEQERQKRAAQGVVV